MAEQTRVDHFIWVVSPENVKRYVQEFSVLFETTFSHLDGPALGPYPRGRGLHAYVSWERGLEFIAPVSSADPVAAPYWHRLEQFGEGPCGLVVGVPDVDAARILARDLGHPVSEVVQLADTVRRREVLRSWTTNVTDVREAVVMPDFLRSMLLVGEVHYPKPTDKGARLDHVIWVAKQANIDNYARVLAELFDTSFDHLDSRKLGARRRGSGIQAYVSWEVGFQRIAPVDSSDRLGERVLRHLQKFGESVYGVAIGVRDLEATVDRARKLGYPVDATQTSADDLAWAKGLRSRKAGVLDVREAELHHSFLTSHLIALEIT